MALDPWWLIALKLGAVFALVALNGFFVAAEFAIVKVRDTQLVTLAQQGDARAVRATKVVEHLDAYLSATQLGITLASLGLGWIGEPAVARLIEPVLLGAGVANPAVLHTVAFALAFGSITFLHIVFGELAPKSLAIQRAKSTTLATAKPLHLFYVLFRPAIWALNGTANWFLRRIGLPPVSAEELAHSEEEMRLLLGGASAAGSKLRRDLILRAMDLRRRRVRDIMVPRPFVVALSTERTLAENYRAARESGFTRFPLVRGDLDRVLGMVHFKDLSALADEVTEAPLEVIRRDVLIVPASLRAEELLTRFLQRHQHLAIVMDEFGSVVGIVTLEDVLEELVGQIQDEFDVEVPTVRQVGPDRWAVEGHVPLHEVEPVVGPIPRNPDVTTLGGHITASLGHIPRSGERVVLNGYELVVRAVERRRVRSVEIRRLDEEAEDLE